MSARHPADAAWPLRWDLLQRYRLIEIIALWEGRLTTNHLCTTFGIGRQQASKDLNDYLTGIGAGNLAYDKHIKGYRPTPDFMPRVTSGVADEYLHLLNRNSDLNRTFEALHLASATTEVVQIPLRQIDPAVIRSLVAASRQRQRVEVNYVSLQNPNHEGRIIAPHTIVNAGSRWHVRAYCEKNGDFRDFVLTRFRGVPSHEGETSVSDRDDDDWNRRVSVHVVADRRLSREQRRIIEHDYGMQRGALKINTRAALAQYVVQAFRVNPRVLRGKPEAQQVEIANLEELRPWLFE